MVAAGAAAHLDPAKVAGVAQALAAAAAVLAAVALAAVGLVEAGSAAEARALPGESANPMVAGFVA